MSLPATKKRCGKCGAETTIDGICPACLLESGLSHEMEAGPVLPPSFGDYEVMAAIAQGGMGVVYKARQRSLNRIVAVKMVLTGRLAKQSELRRFRVEAETAARLQHPNIVAIHEVGEVEGQPFFSMDYVEGKSLAELAHNEPIPEKRAAVYLRSISQAIEYAHSKGVLHRDLKPSNILIDQSDQPRITDFGLAKRLDDYQASTDNAQLTLTGQILGSPNFMPPEQAAGERGAISPASDVYSMGAILYQLLTGRPPFRAETLTQTLRLVAEVEAASPRLLNPGLSRDLETICLKCMQKNQAARYTTAQALADDLGLFLEGEPIRARPVGEMERVWRWCRRKPGMAAMAGVVLVLVFMAATGSVLYNVRLKAANQRASDKLWEAYLGQARAERWSGQAGRRFRALELLEKAARIRPAPEIRNEVIASLALTDLRTIRCLEHPADTAFAFSRDYSNYAAGDLQGTVTVRGTCDDVELARFAGFPTSPYGPLFSPSGKYLAISRTDGLRYPFELWEIAHHQLVLSLPDFGIRDLDFSPDEQFLYLTQMGRPAKIVRFGIPSGESEELFHTPALPSAVKVSPGGDLLAVGSAETKSVEVYSSVTGKSLYPLPQPNFVQTVDWHPEGRLLAVACGDGRVYIWDTVDRKLFHVLEGHTRMVTTSYFSHDGNLLASGSWDGTFRIWNGWTGREILQRPGDVSALPFSANDRQIGVPMGSTIDLAELPANPVWRGLYVAHSENPAGAGFGWSTDGRWIISTHRDGGRIWDTIRGREIALLPSDGGEPWFSIFDGTGSNVIMTTGAGLRCWPFIVRPNKSSMEVSVGPVEKLGPEGLTGGGLEMSQRGDRLAAEIGGVVKIFDWPSLRELQTLRMEPAVFQSRLSPSGKYCVGWPHAGTPNRVWEVNTGNILTNIDFKGSAAAFTPDDRWLVLGSTAEYVGWNIESWRPVWTIPRPNTSASPRLAFSHDGRMGALTFSAQTIRLFEPGTGQELATLEAPDQQIPSWLAFSPDDNQLAATTGSSVIHVWNLRLLRQELVARKLDWNAPPLPAARDSQPTFVTVAIQGAPNAVPAADQFYFPPRDPLCRSNLIDLTRFYNASLTNSWFNPYWVNNNLAALDSGLRELDATQFDIRGIVQVSCSNRDLIFEYPTEVTGIPVHQQCHAIHFLHANGWRLGFAGGDIGEYLIHYEDGVERLVPLVSGENIWDWWGPPGYTPPLKPGTSLGWRGRNPLSENENQDLLLFHFRWENPRPDAAIASITFRSRMTRCAPFLIAITVE